MPGWKTGPVLQRRQADDRHRAVYNEFIEEFTKGMADQVTGDPFDPGTTYGPLSSEAAAKDLMDQIEDAVCKGATLHTGGH